MSWKTDIVTLGALGVGAYVVLTNLPTIGGGISDWLKGLFASNAGTFQTTTGTGVSPGTGETVNTQTVTGPSGVGVTTYGGGTITMPNGTTVSSSQFLTNTSGNQQGAGAANTSPSLNQVVGGTGLTPHVTNTAATFNPSLPPAVAWAQPGSPAWVAYYGG